MPSVSFIHFNVISTASAFGLTIGGMFRRANRKAERVYDNQKDVLYIHTRPSDKQRYLHLLIYTRGTNVKGNYNLLLSSLKYKLLAIYCKRLDLKWICPNLLLILIADINIYGQNPIYFDYLGSNGFCDIIDLNINTLTFKGTRRRIVIAVNFNLTRTVYLFLHIINYYLFI